MMVDILTDCTRKLGRSRSVVDIDVIRFVLILCRLPSASDVDLMERMEALGADVDERLSKHALSWLGGEY